MHLRAGAGEGGRVRARTPKSARDAKSAAAGKVWAGRGTNKRGHSIVHRRCPQWASAVPVAAKARQMMLHGLPIQQGQVSMSNNVCARASFCKFSHAAEVSDIAAAYSAAELDRFMYNQFTMHVADHSNRLQGKFKRKIKKYKTALALQEQKPSTKSRTKRSKAFSPKTS